MYECIHIRTGLRPSSCEASELGFGGTQRFRAMTATKEKLTCPIHTRVSKPEFDRLEKLRSNSNCSTMAEFLRAIIQQEKINWYHRNAELDGLALEFAQIRKELNAIGRNMNQITKAFHHANNPGQKIMQALKGEGEYKKVEGKVNVLLKMMNDTVARWSRK